MNIKVAEGVVLAGLSSEDPKIREFTREAIIKEFRTLAAMETILYERLMKPKGKETNGES